MCGGERHDGADFFTLTLPSCILAGWQTTWRAAMATRHLRCRNITPTFSSFRSPIPPDTIVRISLEWKPPKGIKDDRNQQVPQPHLSLTTVDRRCFETLYRGQNTLWILMATLDRRSFSHDPTSRLEPRHAHEPISAAAQQAVGARRLKTQPTGRSQPPPWRKKIISGRRRSPFAATVHPTAC